MDDYGATIMPLARVKQKGQVTIPANIREELGLHEGDYVEVTTEGSRVVLTPQQIAPRHPEIDAALAEGLADIQAGRLSPSFTTAEEIAAWQKTAEYKKFIGKE
jgi:AbrB family looped-hinge helix DNA binding protein